MIDLTNVDYENLGALTDDQLLTISKALESEIATLDSMQQSRKVRLNSAYGALGNAGFRWFMLALAEGITSSGQLTTRWIEGVLNRFFNKVLKTQNVDYVIACDTDSVYLRMGEFVKASLPEDHGMTNQEITKMLDQLCQTKLQSVIDNGFQDLCNYVNGYEQKMKMKRECIANRGIWVAAKRYILNVYNKEGVAYEVPKLKMTGIEAIRTSTPQVCRDAIKETLFIMLNKDEKATQDYIEQFKNKFLSLPFEDVAKPSSVNGMNEYADKATVFKKGTPTHVRGALMYNKAINDLKLNGKYESIGSGQKIRWAYCIMPNPLRTKTIASPGPLPPEMNMDKYIDKHKQLETTYMKPITNILDKIGWTPTEKRTLLEFLVDD